MSERMAKLYEKAWNQTVQGLNNWKKNIIINHPLSTDRMHQDVSREVARDAARLAEQWDKEEAPILSGNHN
tara:strand:- start:369 stop:581 length:213 start_codon:yes stop_codon:yes gene_type:complete